MNSIFWTRAAPIDRLTSKVPQGLLFLLVGVVTLIGGAVEATGQEAEVRTAVERTLAAWTAGDFETAAEHYDAEVRGYFLDGGALVSGFNAEALRAAFEAGVKADLSITQLDVRVTGDVALTAGRLAGSITMPGGAPLEGAWRYTETRLRRASGWKVVQYHFSAVKQ